MALVVQAVAALVEQGLTPVTAGTANTGGGGGLKDRPTELRNDSGVCKDNQHSYEISVPTTSVSGAGGNISCLQDQGALFSNGAAS